MSAMNSLIIGLYCLEVRSMSEGFRSLSKYNKTIQNFIAWMK